MGLMAIRKKGKGIDMIDRQMRKGTEGKLKNKWYIMYNNKKYIVNFYEKTIPFIRL